MDRPHRERTRRGGGYGASHLWRCLWHHHLCLLLLVRGVPPMSIMTTEYAVHRVRDDEIRSTHGPYATFEVARLQQRGGERMTDENPDCRGLEEWVIMERDVTPWTPVPRHDRDWPDDD